MYMVFEGDISFAPPVCETGASKEVCECNSRLSPKMPTCHQSEQKSILPQKQGGLQVQVLLQVLKLFLHNKPIQFIVQYQVYFLVAQGIRALSYELRCRRFESFQGNKYKIFSLYICIYGKLVLYLQSNYQNGKVRGCPQNRK